MLCLLGLDQAPVRTTQEEKSEASSRRQTCLGLLRSPCRLGNQNLSSCICVLIVGVLRERRGYRMALTVPALREVMLSGLGGLRLLDVPESCQSQHWSQRMKINLSREPR